MKNVTAVMMVLTSLLAVNSALAAEMDNSIAGKQKIGVVSAENAYSLDGLTNKLSHKARAQGATAIKVIAAGGDNKLHGVAEIYK
ncbi:YdgH/BhsA/McbA-like domain containing protein [Erwinia mallotivora]|uniref:YdgH/BhsA/McbA-like domain containing protein n=1 Tax=Erwinia mallotivora TaxID=69222 RepID=UPI0021C1696D|nr:YdgH/BhsA/McbA-like domain containing protein [Erwinia mallotivora]